MFVIVHLFPPNYCGFSMFPTKCLEEDLPAASWGFAVFSDWAGHNSHNVLVASHCISLHLIAGQSLVCLLCFRQEMQRGSDWLLIFWRRLVPFEENWPMTVEQSCAVFPHIASPMMRCCQRNLAGCISCISCISEEADAQVTGRIVPRIQHESAASSWIFLDLCALRTSCSNFLNVQGGRVEKCQQVFQSCCSLKIQATKEISEPSAAGWSRRCAYTLGRIPRRSIAITLQISKSSSMLLLVSGALIVMKRLVKHKALLSQAGFVKVIWFSEEFRFVGGTGRTLVPD